MTYKPFVLKTSDGGTGDTSFTAYSVLCSGTTSSGSLQNVSGLGSSGQVLTSNGVAALPTWQNASGGGITTIDGDSGSITGSTVTVQANVGSLGCGASVQFTNSSSTSTLSVTDGNNSTLIGSGAGKAGASGANNCALGHSALSSMTSADSNMAFGTSALASCTSGQFNTAVGVIALQDLTTTSQNTAIGRNALGQIVTGSNNGAFGYNSGANLTTNDSNNIMIMHAGVAGDNGVIRIGTNGTHTSCLIQGISGVTVTGTAVLCSTAGQLGTIASSKRYKENIEDVEDETSSLVELKVKKFNYIGYSEKKYGLIAEDVEEKFPYLVFYNEEKQPESVLYHEMPALLLLEIQKLHSRIKCLESKINNLNRSHV